MFSFCVLSLHAGLVDIGVTLLCPENLGPDEVEERWRIKPCCLTCNRCTGCTRQPHWLLQPAPRRARKAIFQVDIFKHLIPFGKKACPD